MRQANGFTLLEVMLVMVIAGTMMTIAVPRIGNSVVRESLRGARSMVSIQLAQARGVATHRACPATLHIVSGGTARSWVTSCRTDGTAGLDTMDFRQLSQDYSISLTSNVDSIVFAPNGMSASATWATMVFARNGHTDSLSVTPIGRIAR